jgi:hypothetical protein
VIDLPVAVCISQDIIKLSGNNWSIIGGFPYETRVTPETICLQQMQTCLVPVDIDNNMLQISMQIVCKFEIKIKSDTK